MACIQIDPFQLVLRPHHLFDQQMVLLTCGDFANQDFNQMTIGWGSIGTMWNKPFVQIAVRPTRYTFGEIPGFHADYFSGRLSQRSEIPGRSLRAGWKQAGDDGFAGGGGQRGWLPHLCASGVERRMPKSVLPGPGPNAFSVARYPAPLSPAGLSPDLFWGNCGSLGR